MVIFMDCLHHLHLTRVCCCNCMLTSGYPGYSLIGMYRFMACLVILIPFSAEGLEHSRFEWTAGEWDGCQSDTCGGSGSTTREVYCMETTSNRTVIPGNCTGMPRPASYKQCYRVCDYHRYQYTWQLSSWSSCQPRYGKQLCAEDYGIQNRNVTCVAKCGGTAPSEVLCEHFQHKPASKQMCPLTCPQDCITSDFKSWQKCDSCFHKQKSRHRTVIRAPQNGGSFCKKLVEYERCVLSAECYENRGDNFQYKFTNWTNCIRLSQYNTKVALEGNAKKSFVSQDMNSILGYQKRTVHCIDVSGFNVDERFCAHICETRPLTQQVCILPRDCLVSNWSTWSNWTSIGQPYPSGTSRDSYTRSRDFYRQMGTTQAQEEKAVLRRHRNLIQVSRGRGKACPSLVEDKLQLPKLKVLPCNRYQWLEGEWGVCQAQQAGDGCGMGIHNRTVLCVKLIRGVPPQYGTPVEDFHCATAAPQHTKSCDIPCPVNCEVTQWTHWGDCLPMKCMEYDDKGPSRGYRVRRRYIKTVSNYGGETCPHLEESQSCIYPHCYTWKVDSSRGKCKLHYSDMGCGEGKVDRFVTCINMYGETVPNSQCRSKMPATRERCHVPCDNDCVVTSWSEWSTCPNKCDSNSFVREKELFRHRTKKILVENGTNTGIPCPREKFLQEEERCEKRICITYHWETSPWGVCTLAGALRHCGIGTQRRYVTCHRDDGANVASPRCADTLKPAMIQNCSVPCQKGCILSNFTEWTPCSRTCISEAGVYPSQQKYRFVLDNRHNVACGHLMESRECKGLPECVHYTWKVNAWSGCVTLEECGEGYRSREIECRNNKDEVLPEEICISQLGNMPNPADRCSVPCKHGRCLFSDWSDWSGCSKRCDGVMTRYRSMEGSTSEFRKCWDRTIYPLEEKRSCVNHCSKYTALPHEKWSSCILTVPEDTMYSYTTDRPIAMLKYSYDVCGIGKRYQALVCADGRGNNVSGSVCYQKDFVEEVCFTPCAQDCQMTEWSKWTNCKLTSSQTCGNGEKTRFRFVEKPAIDGGRDCPPLVNGEQYEYQPCHVECEVYNWEGLPWSTCNVDISVSDSTGRLCGSGWQTRTVKCTKLIPASPLISIETDAAHCESQTKPSQLNYCDVICPGDCVLTEWEPWSKCKQGCEGNRTRTRSIVRYPKKLSDRCKLLEKEDCLLGDNCFEYFLSWTNWGSCVLPSDRQCGIGQRRSYSQCVRNDGVIVNRKYCQDSFESELGEAIDVTVESCLIPCPIDCVVSQWTPWSPCSKSCDLGFQQRYRHIVIYPKTGGRKCAEDLRQERPCSFTECFKWQVSDWGTCQIMSGACGFGLQQRHLNCVRHDGLPVENNLCPDGGKTFFQLERVCLSACPGDCWVSEWSSWGPCHRPCVPEITEGVQTRSRAITSEPDSHGTRCPNNLIETRACHGGICPVYEWVPSYWFGDQRHVWCQSSADGVVVEGGCDFSIRPPSKRICSTPCTVEHSYCSDVNHCSCTADYNSHYDAEGYLTHCTDITAMHNRSKHTAEVTLPDGSLTNVWMYAVIAAGSAFILFVIVAIFFITKYSRRDQQHELHSLQNSSHSTTLKNSVHNNKSPVKDPTACTLIHDTYKDEYS